MSNTPAIAKLSLVALSIALFSGCASDQPKSNASASTSTQASQTPALKTPTKEILIFEGDSNRAYVPLGSIEYKLDHGIEYGNTLDVPMEAQKELKEGLKKVAYSQYGEKVDAIINVKMGKQIAGGLGGTFIAGFGAHNTMASSTGVAVSYQTEPEVTKPALEIPVAKPAKKRAR